MDTTPLKGKMLEPQIMTEGDAATDVPLPPGALHQELARLATLSALDYQRERSEAAQRLCIGVGVLDKAIKSERVRQRGEREQAHRRRSPPEPGEVREPFGFFRRDGELYGDTGADMSPVWLAAPFDVLGEGRDGTGNEWGLWLRWHDGDGRLHTWMMPAALLRQDPEAVEAELARRGLRTAVDPTARMMLRRYLAEVQAGNRVQIAYACGWQGTDPIGPYLLPDGTVLGGAVEPVILHALAPDAAQRCGTNGSLAGWQSGVAALAVGNPLAAFCISVAFAGPLLLPAGEPGGGFHLTGESKRGKTLVLQMGLSAWGLPYKAGGALRDWRTTANALEAAGEEASDGLLALDELHQANPSEVAAASYMLADGAGKGRLNRDASARRRRTWRSFILSTGEHDIATAAARGGQRLPAGADVRLPSVPVPDVEEAWPCLHGRANLSALWDDLHRAMRAQHGEAARVFLTHLTLVDGAKLREEVGAMRNRFAEAVPSQADPQVREVARRFALVALAGEMARAWGILPWPVGEAERAANAMLAAWLQQRSGGAGSSERAAHLERVRLFLVQHGAARFTVLVQGTGAWEEAHSDRPVVNRAGWRKLRAGGGRDEYLISPEVLKAEICAPAGFDAAAVARTLAQAGFLRHSEQGRLQAQERVPGLARPTRVYAVSAEVLEVPEPATVVRNRPSEAA